MKQLAPASSRLPDPPATLNPETRTYLQRLIKALVGVDIYTVRTNIAVGSILLASPNGSVYTVRVKDDGTLETELTYDGS